MYCSLSGFGQTGEMRDWPAYDHTIQAMSGMMWTGGDDVPTQGRGFSIDCFAGYVAFASILGSLFRRERTGAGPVPGRGDAGCQHGADGRRHRAPDGGRRQRQPLNRWSTTARPCRRTGPPIAGSS